MDKTSFFVLVHDKPFLLFIILIFSCLWNNAKKVLFSVISVKSCSKALFIVFPAHNPGKLSQKKMQKTKENQSNLLTKTALHGTQ